MEGMEITGLLSNAQSGEVFASAFFLTLGATPSATKWYWYIASAHMQMAVQALEAFSICSGVNSGLLLNGSTCG